MTAPDLAPCPFCGSTELEFLKGTSAQSADGKREIKSIFRALCRVCKAESRVCDSEANALIAWNKRTSPAPTDRERAIEECAKVVTAYRKVEEPDLLDIVTDIRALLTTQPTDDGWIKIDAAHPLPDDLKVGDEVQLILHRHAPFNAGEEFSPVAYRRASGER